MVHVQVGPGRTVRGARRLETGCAHCTGVLSHAWCHPQARKRCRSRAAALVRSGHQPISGQCIRPGGCTRGRRKSPTPSPCRAPAAHACRPLASCRASAGQHRLTRHTAWFGVGGVTPGCSTPRTARAYAGKHGLEAAALGRATPMTVPVALPQSTLLCGGGVATTAIVAGVTGARRGTARRTGRRRRGLSRRSLHGPLRRGGVNCWEVRAQHSPCLHHRRAVGPPGCLGGPFLPRRASHQLGAAVVGVCVLDEVGQALLGTSTHGRQHLGAEPRQAQVAPPRPLALGTPTTLTRARPIRGTAGATRVGAAGHAWSTSGWRCRGPAWVGAAIVTVVHRVRPVH